MKNIILTTITATIIIGLSACSDNADFTNETKVIAPAAQQRIAIDANCTNPAVIADYIALESGDIITKELKNSSIITYHDTDGVKKVCLKYGKATILRASK